MSAQMCERCDKRPATIDAWYHAPIPMPASYQYWLCEECLIDLVERAAEADMSEPPANTMRGPCTAAEYLRAKGRR